MLQWTITRVVMFCTWAPRSVIAGWLALAVLSALFAVQHFAISTDISKLISSDLPWRKRELAYEAAFPNRNEFILIVVDAPTPELVSEAEAALVNRLRQQPKLFPAVRQTGSGPFFEQNALLFMPTAELQTTVDRLSEAAPLLRALAHDPSLRGLGQAVTIGLAGVQMGKFSLDDLARPLYLSQETIERVLGDKPTAFSWRVLLNGKPAEPRELRRFINVKPFLDYSAIEPGRAATDGIRAAAAELELASKFRARVRLTGPIPIADEEFATVQDGALLNGLATLLIVLGILWLALRSERIVLAVFTTVIVGLSVTAAVGLLLVGTLNMISVAFAVLFIGLGVDFGIQYAVRYREERYEFRDLRTALLLAAQKAGPPLTLAAAAVAAGFLAFLPTAYRGVSELGQIAGAGMIIAYVIAITMLPALLMVLKPPRERKQIGFSVLAPVDRFLYRHRLGVIVGTTAVVLLATPLLFVLQFDFNPINLRSSKVESIATYLDLRNDAANGNDSITLLAPSEAEADAMATKLAAVSQVLRTMTLRDLVPGDQEHKLPLVRGLAEAIGPVLDAPPAPPPTVWRKPPSARSVRAPPPPSG
jgi:hopanoid biosynthesis associated RND transporter like protein HpnN